MSAEPASRTPTDSPLAIYANYCEVGFNAYEFLIDFGQFRPEQAAIHVHSRIVSGPVQAKLFARMLSDAVARHEAEHGLIADVEAEDALEALFASATEFERQALTARRRRGANLRPAPDALPPDPGLQTSDPREEPRARAAAHPDPER